MASEGGHMDIVKYLVGEGAKIERNKDGVGDYTKRRLMRVSYFISNI